MYIDRTLAELEEACHMLDALLETILKSDEQIAQAGAMMRRWKLCADLDIDISRDLAA